LPEICAYIERQTARVLAMADADIVDPTAQFYETVWVDQLRAAVRRARDRAIVERIWRAT
jgi:hypothetical protein